MESLELIVTNGALAGRRFEVGEGGVRLGRSSSNDIHVADESLSRNHCLFERDESGFVLLTDLASANGTLVNGTPVGTKTVRLRVGDVIEAGGVLLRVSEPLRRSAPASEPSAVPKRSAVETDAPPASVDLGLGGRRSARRMAAAASSARRRHPLVNVLWILVIGLLGFAGYLTLRDRVSGLLTPPVSPIVSVDERESLVGMRYEKVEASSESVFRYALVFAEDGTLSVELDDVPTENRRVVKSAKLGETSRARLAEILADPGLATLDAEYAGPESDPPVLKSRALTVVWSRRVQSVRCVNANVPEVLRRLCESLETFSRNELGAWTLGHSRAQLVEMATRSAEVGRVKWEDRESDYGNVAAAVRAYREAVFYLETVNPKPEGYESWRKALAEAEADLDRRYREQRFRADRAINLSDWEVAHNDLRILCEIVPDREDARHREAAAKLVDVENRLQKGAK